MDARTPALQLPIVTTERERTIRKTHSAGRAATGDSPILHAAIGLAEQIRAASDEIERGRRIPPAIAQATKDAGVFGMAMPRVWGGPELDPLTQFRVIEALAMADGSAGWCAMIGCDGGYHSLSRSGRRTSDVSRCSGRHRRCCNDDRAG
jgi:alkylation response protein AidB-like acyl-CoA dehydrogenase